MKQDEPSANQPEGSGHGLLWVLIGAAVVLTIAHPRAPAAWLALVDWHTIGALAGLLAIMQAVEQSGVLQSVARRLLARVTDLRTLALALVLGAALLSALVTNDVSLFLLVPLTRVLATQARLPLAELVVLEALAVNAGSALTPIGNPQNLYLWHRSGLGFGAFVVMMLPTVAVMLGWLLALVVVWIPRTQIELATDAAIGERRPRLLAASALLFLGFVIALDRDWLWPALGVTLATLLLVEWRVLRKTDWTLLVIIALMFVDLRQLADLPIVARAIESMPIEHGWRAYLAAVATSQVISNVPAAILLDGYVHDLPALAAGVSVGGFGCVIGSLANLIALRLAKLPKGLRAFHRVSVPFLLVVGASVCVLQVLRS